MAVEKQIEPSPLEADDDVGQVQVEVVNPDAVSIQNEEGGMIIDFTGDIVEDIVGPAHDDNLAEYIEEDELMSMASEIIHDFNTDRNSRSDWASAYVKGLDLMGMKIEERTQPWQGAAGVFHPVMTEAVVRFQAQAMGELFPASGPVRTKVLGEKKKEKIDQAKRIEDEMNYLLTEEMTEYRDETESMLFRLPLAGSSFKKVYYDPLLERPVSMFVPAEDFVVSYGCSDLATSPRYTHVMKRTANEVAELQVNGFYRDVDLPAPEPDYSDIQEKYDEIEGETTTLEDDDRHTILEVHIDIDLPEPFEDSDGLARPHIISIDKSSSTILSIRRNWYEDDIKKRKRLHFVHYRYLPGLGFYGTGLIHLIGGLAKSATSILRQLIDAGTLSNLPAGLKARGLRIKGDDSPLMPGEFRDVDVPGGAIRDSIAFLPYKEPSSVLYQLLGNIVEEGRRIGSVADVQVGNLNPQAPVGTTLALMERSMKVMSGVQARLHASLKNELRLLSKVIKDNMSEDYLYDMDSEFNRQEDFDDRIDVIPVSDPNAATMAQRVVQYQAAMQLAQQAPQLYNMGKIHRQMLEVLGIKDADEIIKLPEDIAPKDPVSENMAVLKQEPVKAFKYQDHEAHIAVHMSAMQDPKLQEIVGQSPFASVIQNAMSAHITEHIAFQYRREIEKQLGVELPDEDQPIPEDVEEQISKMSKDAAEKLLGKNQAEQQQQQAQQQQQDPVVQMQQRELAIKEQELQHKIAMDIARLDQQEVKDAANMALQKTRLESEEKREGARLGLKAATELDKEERKDKREGAKIGLEIAREMAVNEDE